MVIKLLLLLVPTNLVDIYGSAKKREELVLKVGIRISSESRYSIIN